MSTVRSTINLKPIAFWGGLAMIGFHFEGFLGAGIVLTVGAVISELLDRLDKRLEKRLLP